MSIVNNNKIIIDIMNNTDHNLTNSDFKVIVNNLKKMTGIFTKLVEYDINGTIKSGKPFLKDICNNINSSFNTEFTKKEIYELLEMIAKTKNIKRNKTTVNNIKQMTGGFEISEKNHFWIGVLGLIPAFGSLPDAINIILYLSKGKYKEALWSLLAFLPIIGLPVGIYNLFYRQKNKDEENDYDDEDYDEYSEY